MFDLFLPFVDRYFVIQHKYSYSFKILRKGHVIVMFMETPEVKMIGQWFINDLAIYYILAPAV